LWQSVHLEHFYVLCGLVSTGVEAVSAVFGGDFLEGVGDGVPELGTGSGLQVFLFLLPVLTLLLDVGAILFRGPGRFFCRSAPAG